MAFDIMTTLALISSIIIIWFQRKSIMELERDTWEIESAYKNETGKPYQYKHRQFELWGNNGEKEKRKQN